MKPQKIVKNREEKKPLIINEKQQAIIEGKIASEKPVRAVYFVEVGNLPPSKIQDLYGALNAEWVKAQGGMHYVIPVRDGRITGDILFEQEILKIVNRLCEVKDGQIALRNGYEDVIVIRKSV